ncbi:MAG: hypothetical protein Q8O05_04300 [Chloroflexota bacterium]|nr:hypothetical protein [Chloroflexota bacterium]
MEKTKCSVVKEAQLRKAVRRAFKALLDSVASEPDVVIEAGAVETELDEQSLSDIRGWLFSRKETKL